MSGMGHSIPAHYKDLARSQWLKTITSYGTVNALQKADPLTPKPNIRQVIGGEGRARRSYRIVRHRLPKTKHHRKRKANKKKHVSHYHHHKHYNNSIRDIANVSDFMKSAIFGRTHLKGNALLHQHRGLDTAKRYSNVLKNYSNAKQFKNNPAKLASLGKRIYYDSMYHLNNHFHH